MNGAVEKPETTAIWIDLTDLAAWTAHMTGIQRVVFNIAKIFAANGTARFFVYDPSGRVDEVDFAEATSGIGRGTADPAPPSLVHLTVSYGRKAARELGRRVISVSLRSRVRSRIAARRERRRQRSIMARGVVAPPALQHPFASGDVVVLMGASWREGGQLDFFTEARRRNGIALVHTVYDLIPTKFPQFFGLGFGEFFLGYMFEVFGSTDHLLAISQHTLKDSVEFQQQMKLPAVPISVFALGDDPTHLTAEDSPDTRIVSGGFILAVGTLEVRKNYLALYEAWTTAWDRGIDFPPLVIVGQVGWLTGDLVYQIQTDPRVKDRIILRTATDDAELAWLYANCLFTVYPSWYEGWGLPIAEALHYGKVCIASNTSSMPEIGGELVEYCDPHEPEQFLAAVERFASDPPRLAAAEARIRAQYRPRTWELGYSQMLAALESVVRVEV